MNKDGIVEAQVVSVVPEPQQGGYPMQQQGGYPMQQQGGYPMQQQGGYPMQQQGGYPMQQSFMMNQTSPQPQMMMQQAPMMSGPPPKVGGYEVIANSAGVVIRQRFHIAEAVAQQLGCGCLEQKNQYDIYDATTGMPIVFVQEESDVCCRICCKPNHEAKLNFFDTRYGVPENTIAMVGDKPFKFGCCAICDICQREVRAHLPSGEKFSVSKMPFLGGGMTPKIEVMDRTGQVYSTIKGPAFVVGGLIELCGDIHFDVLQGDGSSNTVIGRLYKKKPEGAENQFKEAFGDNDMFVLEFPPNATPEQKMALLSNAIMMDYLFFESGPPLSYNALDGSCTVNFCNLYCCGCSCPCSCTCGGNNGSSD